MATLQLPPSDYGANPKHKALEDASKMQSKIEEDCRKKGYDLPPYTLTELIGKGSFGRVYKARSSKPDTPRLVAVKIIDIEESDSLDPKTANTYSEIMREISTLKVLKDGGARNINLIVDAIPVGQSMWMVTEHCAGGSVATLMRPTGGLQEKWIIPILREVAEALFWVHKEGIIHRDIKCANVLITEQGEVQLCDFGVAGLIETKFDKRSTFTGTLHWMAPEFFDPSRSYDTKVDIWAFGSLVYEIASGFPPNVTAGPLDVGRFGSYLKQHIPRLEGDIYSPQLKDLVAFCMVEDPEERPAIEQVQHHPYIFNTSYTYPTATLAKLVNAYKVWESQGGVRKSLFGPGGAQLPSDYMPNASEEWSFSSTNDFDLQSLEEEDVMAVYDVYGSNVDFPHSANDATPKPTKKGGRRRPPPQILALKAPLEKVFDPNTITNYEDNSRAYYNLAPEPEPAKPSDLPLRDDSLHSTLRESLIDLDAGGFDMGFSRFANEDTIRAVDNSTAATIVVSDASGDMAKPPLSDPADLKNNRRTQDWTFPSMAPASARPEVPAFPAHISGDDGDALTPSQRPPLLHHPTDSVLPLTSTATSSAAQLKPLTNTVANNRISAGSLIDLDESLPDLPPGGSFGGSTLNDSSRPSTSHSDVASLSGSEAPFEFENHASVYAPFGAGSAREPSIYVSDDSFAREPSIYVSDDGEYPRWAEIDRGPSSSFAIGPGAGADDASQIQPGGLPLVLGAVQDSRPFDARESLLNGGPGGVLTAGQGLGPSLAMGEYALHGGPAGDLDSGMRWTGHLPDDRPQQEGGMTLSRSSSINSATNGYSSSSASRSRGASLSRPYQNGNGNVAHGLGPISNVMPSVPRPPAESVMMGLGSPTDLKSELGRLLASLQDHLGHSIAALEGLPVRRMEPRGVVGNGMNGTNGINGAGHVGGAGSGGSVGIAGADGVDD